VKPFINHTPWLKRTPPPEGAQWGLTATLATPFNFFPTRALSLQPGTYVLPVNTLCWLIDYTWGGEEDAWDYPARRHDVIFNTVLERTISFQGALRAL